MRTAPRVSSSMRRPGLAASAALLLVAAAATGRAATTAGIAISHPWMRFLTLEIPAAGYFTLHNDTAKPVVLTGAKSPDCGQLMLHRSVVSNHMASMVMVPSITVAAHGSVTFQPGGYHLMCMSPSTSMAPGKHVPVTLTFAHAPPLAAEFPVYGSTGK